MQTTQSGGPMPALHDPAVLSCEQAGPDRLPLRQGWKLLGDGTPKLALASLGDPRGVGARFTILAQGAQGAQGELRARNERALRDAREVLRNAHRGAVRFTPPRAHTWFDPVQRVTMEPLMFVKVNARREHLAGVLEELRARDARMEDVELQGREAVVRTEARLAALLGFEEAVLALSERSAHVFTWLLRYEAAAHEGE